jgi:hypothetical protein
MAVPLLPFWTDVPSWKPTDLIPEYSSSVIAVHCATGASVLVNVSPPDLDRELLIEKI